MRAAALLALAYLLCLLAPPAAFAFGDGSRAAHCLTEDNHGLPHVHPQSDVGQAHVHGSGTSHVHQKQVAATKTNSQDTTADGQCCGLVCLSAIPTLLPDVTTPVAQGEEAIVVVPGDASGQTPALLYRPPNNPAVALN